MAHLFARKTHYIHRIVNVCAWVPALLGIVPGLPVPPGHVKVCQSVGTGDPAGPKAVRLCVGGISNDDLVPRALAILSLILTQEPQGAQP